MRLHPGGHEPRGRSEHEEGEEGGDVDASALPPEDEEEHDRQRAGDRLRQERAGEEAEGQAIGRARAAGGAQVGEEGGEVERAREHVLPLRDPGDRLDVHRMDGEHRRREPRAGERQPPADHPDEDRVGAVQQHVDEVIAEGLDSPEVMLEPEAREGERVVLRDGAGLEPDAPEPVERPQRRVGRDVRVVVPDEARAQGWEVGRDDEEREGHAADGLRTTNGLRSFPMPPAPLGSRPVIG